VQDGIGYVGIVVKEVAEADRCDECGNLDEAVEGEAEGELENGGEGEVEDDAVLRERGVVDLLDLAKERHRRIGGVRHAILATPHRPDHGVAQAKGEVDHTKLGGHDR